MARRVELGRARPERPGAASAASAHRHHAQGRAGQGADLVHPGPHHPWSAAGFLMRAASLQSRGVALILVLTTIAILTSIGVDFSYQSRVSLKLAENLRDETRAYYMAKSAVNLSRLLLHFQKQVHHLGGQRTQGLTQMLNAGKPPAPAVQPPVKGATGAAVSGASAAASSSLGIRLWEILPIDSNAFSGLLQGVVSGVDAKAPETESAPAATPSGKPQTHYAFGSFDGSFHAKIVDENSRINVQGLDGLQTTPLATRIQLPAII